jgi:hypothetical protein
MDRPTEKEWCEFVAKEPALAVLEQDILDFRASKKRLGTCVLGDWYDRFKPRVCELTGWRARNQELKSERIYNIVYGYLDDLLTDRKVKPIRRAI